MSIIYNFKKTYTKVANMTDTEKTEYINNKDWKDYEPSEQLIFEGNTLYLCEY